MCWIVLQVPFSIHINIKKENYSVTVTLCFEEIKKLCYGVAWNLKRSHVKKHFY